MNIFQKSWCRFYQKTIYAVSPFLPWRQPKLLDLKEGIKDLPKFIKDKGFKCALLVTDPMLINLGMPKPFVDACEEQGLKLAIFGDVVPNPTIDVVEKALQTYKDENCECIVALGGGSSMDCAKAVGARVACPKKPIAKMKGILKVRKKLPMLVAIPTTAGTGSETTLAAVISNAETHEKYSINDHALIPEYAVLDASLTLGLPKHITSTTGMDALTHAVEAYIGKSNTKQTKQMAEKAVKLIFDNILTAYENGSDFAARENMLKGSFYAGAAFTRAYVGYVHAIAHTLGGFYHTPHGLANSVILPVILDFYGASIYKKLAKLADIVGISGESDEQKAKAFIQKIKDMNKQMNIPEKFEGVIKEEDIPLMVERAYKEACPLYPVPKFMSKQQLADTYRSLMG
ncbi:MAG: iron-containing alcohol dehydrogenase [Clostridia bacterium]|nr:iron-containing alcohol dehydrogenase [Clostridia bacterium]